MHITENVIDRHAHIGDTFDYEGNTYQAVHSFSCTGCAFQEVDTGCADAPKCVKYDVNFIKINKEE